MDTLQTLKSKYDYIKSAFELVGEYHFHLKGNAPEPFKIRIWKNDQGQYYPELSHFVWTSTAGSEHNPDFHPQGTIEEALDEAFSHGFMFFKADDDKCKWVANQYF
jgi:hypothetical protein